MKKIVALILLCVAVTGCATILSGSRQQIVFSAPEGTQIFLDGLLLAEVPQGYDAVSAEVKRGLSGMDMVAKRAGYQDAHFFVRSEVNGVVFINILLGGIPGLAVDLATGAAAKYPNHIEIRMLPLNK